MSRDLSAALTGARAVVFDFDGTLAPNPDLPRLRREVAEQARRHGVPDRVFDGLYIVELVDAAARWLERGDPEGGRRYHHAAHELITAFELDAAAGIMPFPEVEATLVKLRAAGKRLAVVTRNCGEAVRTIFADVDRYTDTVLTRDDVTHLKPDTRHVAAALAALDVPGGQSLMVGDGLMDMTAGRALGMFCVGVLTGSNGAGALREAGAHEVLPSVACLTTDLS